MGPRLLIVKELLEKETGEYRRRKRKGGDRRKQKRWVREAKVKRKKYNYGNKLERKGTVIGASKKKMERGNG